MRSRRIFLLGAAALLTVAALGAVVAVFTGHFVTLATIALLALAAPILVVAGDDAFGAVLVPVLVPAGVFWRFLGALMLASCGFLIWAEQFRTQDGAAYWKLLPVLLAFAIATLAAATNRSLLQTPQLVRTVFPATAAAAFGAALLGTGMIVTDDGGPWKLLAVLVIVALLGEFLAPILERYVASQE